jgi:hypothetical protein
MRQLYSLICLSKMNMSSRKKSELKLLKLAPLKNNQSIFCALIEVDISTYKKAPSVRYCLIGLDSCTIYDAVEEVSRCFNCNGFNYSSHKCKSALSCPRCAKERAAKECNASELCCVNCPKLKERAEDEVIDYNHAAYGYDKCLAHQQNVGGMNSRINYFFNSTSTCDFDLIAISETWLSDCVYEYSSELVDHYLFSVF